MQHSRTSRQLVGVLVATLLAAVLATAAESSTRTARDTLRDDAITVGSFDFAESELLAEIYSQALEGGGFRVRRAFDLGPREVVAPALASGLLELVPEYAGTALRFSSVGAVTPRADIDETHDALVRALRGRAATALAPAAAQDANTFVVTPETAKRHGLTRLSDLASVSGDLTFGGPPECATRPLCLAGLERVYGVQFAEVVRLDAGGPLTTQALRTGAVDVALLFTTHPALETGDLVELADDRSLQPSENVTPIVRTEVIDRWPVVVSLVDGVSARLTTEALRDMNAAVARGDRIAAVAARWLGAEGLR